MAKVESSKTIQSKALYLSQIGEEFTLTRINSSFKLESEYFGSSHSRKSHNITPVELGFIRRVKNYIRKNQIAEKFINNYYYPKDIPYVSVKSYPDGSKFDEIIEIDIDEAYWRTAYLLGVISESLYIEGSKENGKISKLARLVCLGSLAKKIHIYKFKGRRLLKNEAKRSKLTENIWYSICKRVGDLMNEAKQIAGDDFFLYWVDGIYVKNDPELVNKIKSLFTKFNYDVKTKENLEIEYSNGRAIVKDTISGKKRPFFLSKKTTKPSYFTDEELKETALKFSRYGALDDLND